MVDLAIAVCIGVVKESVATVPVVHPARMIEDWIKADPLHWDAGVVRGYNLVADVIEPISPLVVFCASLGDKNGPLVPVPNFLQNESERPVAGIATAQESLGEMHSFVAVIKIYADHI